MPPTDPPPAGTRSEQELLDDLRTRIRETREAAQRIAAQAPRPPDAGWAVPGDRDGTAGERGELGALVELLEAVARLVPPDLARQLAELVRELLALVRTLIDWYLERAERRRATHVEVQDIPIA